MKTDPGMTKLPPWFTQRLPANKSTDGVTEILESFRLNTVCESASCPNRTSCYGSKTATFMILGKTCTRNCTFCAVNKGRPSGTDPGEPLRIAGAARALKMKYAVITSVTRDDLPDEGDGHFADTVREIKKLNPGIIVELLIPDILNPAKILKSAPDVIGHNLETVPAFYPALRPMAVYEKSLKVLENIKRQSPNTLTKSGIMLGLGETRPQITATMDDLRQAGCDIMTMGQYLRPSPAHYPVKEYISPELFNELGKTALEKGFRAAASAPLVRSSYKAYEIFMEAKNGKL